MEKSLILHISLQLFFFHIWTSVYPVAEYLFLQQFNDMCMIAPMINLKRLEEYQKTAPTLQDLPDNKWLNRRQWFGEGHKYLYAWHKAFDKVNSPLLESRPENLIRYLQNAIKNGPVTPHYYNTDGTFLFNKIQGYWGYLHIPTLAHFAYVPYFFIDQDAMRKLNIKVTDELTPDGGFFAPLAKIKDGKYFIYNLETQQFEETQIPQINQYGNFKFNGEFCYMQILKKNNLGFTEISRIYTIGKGFKITKSDPEQSAYVPYMLGLSKLMFLTLGIDEKNKLVNEESALHAVCIDIQTIVQEDQTNNPWSKGYFNTDNFLQYQLAEMFIKDNKLFEQAKAIINISPLKQWETYTKFIQDVKDKKIYKADKTPYVYNEIKDFLLGDEQALAYFFMQNIRLLWYGTINEQAYYEYTVPFVSLTENRFFPTYFSEYIPYSFANFKKEAFRKKQVNDESISFIDIWKIIVKNFKSHDRKHWISFDAHGWVISFDQTLINLQKEAIEKLPEGEAQKKSRLNLLQELGCTGIESSHSSIFNSFYKRERRQKRLREDHNDTNPTEIERAPDESRRKVRAIWPGRSDPQSMTTTEGQE